MTIFVDDEEDQIAAALLASQINNNKNLGRKQKVQIPKVFRDLKFFLVDVQNKEQLSRMIIEYGGHITQDPNSNAFYVYAQGSSEARNVDSSKSAVSEAFILDSVDSGFLLDYTDYLPLPPPTAKKVIEEPAQESAPATESTDHTEKAQDVNKRTTESENPAVKRTKQFARGGPKKHVDAPKPAQVQPEVQDDDVILLSEAPATSKPTKNPAGRPRKVTSPVDIPQAPAQPEKPKNETSKYSGTSRHSYSTEEDLKLSTLLMRELISGRHTGYGGNKVYQQLESEFPGRNWTGLRGRFYTTLSPRIRKYGLQSVGLTYDMLGFKSQEEMDRHVKVTAKDIAVIPITKSVTGKAQPVNKANENMKTSSAETLVVNDQEFEDLEETEEDEAQTQEEGLPSQESQQLFNTPPSKSQNRSSFIQETPELLHRNMNEDQLFANRLTELAEKSNSSKTQALSALFIANGNWGVALRKLKDLDVRAKCFTARDDAIIMQFLQMGDRFSGPSHKKEYERVFNEEVFVPIDDFERQYADFREMIAVRGEDVIRERIDYLKGIDQELEKRLMSSLVVLKQ